MVSPSCGGGSSGDFFLSDFGCSGAGPESEAIVSGLEDMAVVGEPIEQHGRHLRIAEHIGPFTEAEVGGDNDACALVEL